jgi:hypothetical protein
LSGHIFEKPKEQVEKDCNFRVVVSGLEIGGYGAGCRVAKRPRKVCQPEALGYQ